MPSYPSYTILAKQNISKATNACLFVQQCETDDFEAKTGNYSVGTMLLLFGNSYHAVAKPILTVTPLRSSFSSSIC